MYKVTVIDRDGDEFELENVNDWQLSVGTLQIRFTDGSWTLYASGAWSVATIEPMDNPQVPLVNF